MDRLYLRHSLIPHPQFCPDRMEWRILRFSIPMDYRCWNRNIQNRCCTWLSDRLFTTLFLFTVMIAYAAMTMVGTTVMTALIFSTATLAVSA